MAKPDTTSGGERDVLAGEYALGVLEGEELSAAQQLMLADRDFAEQVRWWNYRLARMAEEAGSVEPGEDVWPAIARRLRSDDGTPAALEPDKPRSGRFSSWNLGAGMAIAAAAAAVVTFIVVTPRGAVEQPAPAPTLAPQQRLVAQLQSADGAISLAGLVEPQAGRISLNIAGLQPASDQAPELWVVPSDGVPRSLGRIPQAGSFSRELTEQERSLLLPGSALAVTYEDSASIPHPAPTTEILALSALSEV